MTNIDSTYSYRKITDFIEGMRGSNVICVITDRRSRVLVTPPRENNFDITCERCIIRKKKKLSFFYLVPGIR